MMLDRVGGVGQLPTRLGSIAVLVSGNCVARWEGQLIDRLRAGSHRVDIYLIGSSDRRSVMKNSARQRSGGKLRPPPICCSGPEDIARRVMDSSALVCLAGTKVADAIVGDRCPPIIAFDGPLPAPAELQSAWVNALRVGSSTATVSVVVRLPENVWMVQRTGRYAVRAHSTKRSLQEFLREVPLLLDEALADVLAGRPPRIPDDKDGHARIGATPGSVSYWNHAFRRIRHLAHSVLTLEKWRVGICHGAVEDVLEANWHPEIEWLVDRRKGYYADPFPVHSTDGGVRILVEDYDHDTRKAGLAALEVKGDIATPCHIAGAGGSHLSYPFAFEEDGHLYCVPESAAEREIVLYRAADGLVTWCRDTVLVKDFAAVDPTIVKSQGRWWLFCTSRDHGPDLRLFVFHAPVLRGPWQSHECNPVKTDISSSRPGGTPFVVGERLFRPSQDSSRTYGGRIAINEITALTPQSFAEITVQHVEPGQVSDSAAGIHTLSYANGIIAVDAKFYAFDLRAARRALVHTAARFARRMKVG